jgi:hypothetical protein
VGNRRSVAVACQQRRRGRETAAGAGPGDAERGITAERTGVLGGPLGGGEGVLDGRRKPVFGGQPVVDRDDDTAHPVGEQPADVVRGVERAETPPAAVIEDERRDRAVGPRPVDPNAEIVRRSGDRAIADVSELGGRPGREVLLLDAARTLDRECVPSGESPLVHSFDDACDLRVEHRARAVDVHVSVRVDDRKNTLHGGR